MKKKIVAYCRVSTNMQSTESQVRVLKQYFESNRVTDFEFFIDEGISGTKSSRPALDRLMQAVANGEIKEVICYELIRPKTIH